MIPVDATIEQIEAEILSGGRRKTSTNTATLQPSKIFKTFLLLKDPEMRAVQVFWGILKGLTETPLQEIKSVTILLPIHHMGQGRDGRMQLTSPIRFCTPGVYVLFICSSRSEDIYTVLHLLTMSVSQTESAGCFYTPHSEEVAAMELMTLRGEAVHYVGQVEDANRRRISVLD